MTALIKKNYINRWVKITPVEYVKNILLMERQKQKLIMTH